MRWWAWVVLSAAVAAVFVGTGLGGPFASVAAAVFLVLLPGIALAQRGVTVDDPGDHRLGIYVTTVLGLGLIALVAVWAWPETFPRPDSGEAGGGDWFGWSGSAMWLAGASALLTAGGLAIFVRLSRPRRPPRVEGNRTGPRRDAGHARRKVALRCPLPGRGGFPRRSSSGGLSRYSCSPGSVTTCSPLCRSVSFSVSFTRTRALTASQGHRCWGCFSPPERP